MKRLYVTEHKLVAYFWAEEGKEHRGAKMALEEEMCMNGLGKHGPDSVLPVGVNNRVWDHWSTSIPWGDAPADMGSATVGEIQLRMQEQVENETEPKP